MKLASLRLSEHRKLSEEELWDLVYLTVRPKAGKLAKDIDSLDTAYSGAARRAIAEALIDSFQYGLLEVLKDSSARRSYKLGKRDNIAFEEWLVKSSRGLVDNREAVIIRALGAAAASSLFSKTAETASFSETSDFALSRQAVFIKNTDRLAQYVFMNEYKPERLVSQELRRVATLAEAMKYSMRFDSAALKDFAFSIEPLSSASLTSETVAFIDGIMDGIAKGESGVLPVALKVLQRPELAFESRRAFAATWGALHTEQLSASEIVRNKLESNKQVLASEAADRFANSGSDSLERTAKGIFSSGDFAKLSGSAKASVVRDFLGSAVHSTHVQANSLSYSALENGIKDVDISSSLKASLLDNDAVFTGEKLVDISFLAFHFKVFHANQKVLISKLLAGDIDSAVSDLGFSKYLIENYHGAVLGFARKYDDEVRVRAKVITSATDPDDICTQKAQKSFYVKDEATASVRFHAHCGCRLVFHMEKTS